MNQQFIIERLKKEDDYKNFLQLLEELTIVEADKITYEEFCKRFDEINSFIFVIKHISTGQIIGTGSIYIEKKFTHKLGSVGHIEDVVIHKLYRNMGLGKTLINHLITFAKQNNCYKVILNCSEINKAFYEKCNFKQRDISMSLYF